MGKPLTPKVIATRKRKAEDAIRRKVQEGHKFKGIKGVRNVLLEDCEDTGVEEDFYDCLTVEDLADLLVKFVDEGVYPAEPPPLHNPVPVPLGKDINVTRTVTHQSDSGVGSSIESSHSDKDREDQNESGIPNKRTGSRDSSNSLSHEDQYDEFFMNIKLPGLTDPELLRACRCGKKQSYISADVFTQSSLQPRPNEQIRLPCWEVGSEMKSRRSIIFQVAGREEVICDLAIGKSYFEEDEDVEGELPSGVQANFLTPVETTVSANSVLDSSLQLNAGEFAADFYFRLKKNTEASLYTGMSNNRRISSGSEGRHRSRPGGYG
ncbi:hypothetical protein EV356DRAFT_5002 [Viridothelium virens]|uniref:Uncharacterized protein n=1 Tax=Viridothelium virens TaxID=1048519 RepID=A0A6A6HPB9_VIRVR|nr:hypothetical protein EV356DRAFT_5002 [Viridothelium virens]